MSENPLADVEQHADRVAALRQELQDELQRRDEAIRRAKAAGYRAGVIRAKAGSDDVPMSGSMYAIIVGGGEGNAE
jgi:hypothetical protein